tara:strand:+ start:1908 stop:2651 length:744 start_codon:yes stop_codon:yes gene_type:complete
MATKTKFFTDLGFQSLDNSTVDGDLTVTGNFTVQGTSLTIDSTTVSVTDSMFELASGNTTSDIIDIGIYGNYDDGLSDGVSEFTGLFRDATDSTWKLFDGLEVEPGNTVNISGTGYAYADFKAGDIEATGQLTAVGPLSLSNLRMDADQNLTTTATTEVDLDTFPLLSYRSAKYHIQASQGTNYHATEVMVIHNSTNAYFSQFGDIYTNNSLFSLSVDTNSGNVRLRVTPASTSSTVFKISRNLLKV